MGALRTGADLATIFCAEEAAVAIKSYNPELMVDGVYSAKKMQSDNKDTKDLEVKNMLKRVTESLDRMHALVIGPGLGRDPAVLKATHSIIKEARKRGISMVLDADALYLLSLGSHDLLTSLETSSQSCSDSAVVLTPNVVEYKRLVDSLADGSEERLKKVLPGVIVVKKGHHDIIERFPNSTCNEAAEEVENEFMISEEKGGLKRCGGIGDILAGNIGVFLAWNQIISKQGLESDLLLSCWMASGLTKRATRAAFLKRKRSMTAPDILDEIGDVVDEVASSTIVEEEYSK
jgi:ATP-dependent NAD(P)H-hydrate dehydratase